MMSKIAKLLERLVDFEDYGDPADAQEIDVFEREVGAKLPADYREFLLTRNGGRLHYRNSYKGDAIERLSGLGVDARCNDLRWTR